MRREKSISHKFDFGPPGRRDLGPAAEHASRKVHNSQVFCRTAVRTGTCGRTQKVKELCSEGVVSYGFFVTHCCFRVGFVLLFVVFGLVCATKDL